MFNISLTSGKSCEYLLFFCIFCVVISTGIIAWDFADGSTTGGGQTEFDIQLQDQSKLPFSERKQIVQSTSNITVVSMHPGNMLVAFAPDGRLLYYNDTLDGYFDVDPSSVGKTTVQVTGEEYLGAEKSRQTVERINLTTGETQTLYSHIIPRDREQVWHDVDRLDQHRLVVADIYSDSIFIVNTTTEERTYEWDAQSVYPLSGGGSWPSDWTHLNDVEIVENDRIMVSLRNQDQVVFIQPGEGVAQNWTLGAENEYDILNEQHNPDYIPRERGGPAVLVADSQNNRVVEYQRTNESWQQSWQWSDAEMQWPRDADRLPNGHTLIADSNSQRILEVNQSGDVVWEIDGITNYDVERLGTGDESSGGYSAQRLDLRSDSVQFDAQVSTSTSKSIVAIVYDTVDQILPNKIFNAFLFVVPDWMSFVSVAAFSTNLVAGISIIILVFRRSSYYFRSPLGRSK